MRILRCSYFKKAETNHAVRDDKFHGQEGPLNVSNVKYTNELIDTFLDASESAGFGRNTDFNNWDKGQQGVGPFHVMQVRPLLIFPTLSPTPSPSLSLSFGLRR